ncbi:hypothetical protein [Conexibacter arvalis]|uniref:Uncharacterized protein n=1 Tax=Conexibacter arvalis TaxID=912552 RepID=A0A840IGS9_9ACTN|nr:hypothetical protein [Conexibacter arvalis]MBB4664092.1 hypothetical protein [Conexibacter arvalis]
MRARDLKLPLVPLLVASAIGGFAASPAIAGAASPVRVVARAVKKPLTTKPARTTITVTNTGKRPVSGLTLAVTARKGVQVTLAGAKRGKPARRLPALKARKRVRVGVSLRRARGGPARGTLTVKVTRGGGRTVAKGRLSFGAPARATPREPSKPTPPANPNTLEGRYFWGSRYTLSGIEQNTLWFTGPNLVHVAETGSAWPTCTAVSETCKSYSYDAASGQLTIDGKPATLAGRRLELDGDSYREFGFPSAGARWDTRLTYSNSTGVCPLFCSYYTENITFMPDGNFVRDSVSSGSGPVVDWAVVPPDSKGTYEIRADRTLRFAFADGRERIETVGLYLNDDGTLQAPGEGVVLGGDGYFDIRD